MSSLSFERNTTSPPRVQERDKPEGKARAKVLDLVAKEIEIQLPTGEHFRVKKGTTVRYAKDGSVCVVDDVDMSFGEGEQPDVDLLRANGSVVNTTIKNILPHHSDEDEDSSEPEDLVAAESSSEDDWMLVDEAEPTEKQSSTTEDEASRETPETSPPFPPPSLTVPPPKYENGLRFPSPPATFDCPSKSPPKLPSTPRLRPVVSPTSQIPPLPFSPPALSPPGWIKSLSSAILPPMPYTPPSARAPEPKSPLATKIPPMPYTPTETADEASLTDSEGSAQARASFEEPKVASFEEPVFQRRGRRYCPPPTRTYHEPRTRRAYQEPPSRRAYRKPPARLAYREPPARRAYRQPPARRPYRDSEELRRAYGMQSRQQDPRHMYYVSADRMEQPRRVRHVPRRRVRQSAPDPWSEFMNAGLFGGLW